LDSRLSNRDIIVVVAGVVVVIGGFTT